MIKFWTHLYELVPMQSPNARTPAAARKGALLKVQWMNGLIGYADIFPWTEYGDLPIEEQIKALSEGKITPLVEQSIWLAKKDANLRKAGKNAFAGALKIKNHLLITDFTKFTDENMKEARTNGYTTLKVKVGRAVDDEAKFCSKIIKQNPVTLRLDFNGATDFSEFERFFSHLSPAEKAKIEFVEDPMPWDEEAWRDCARFAPLAIDMEISKVEWEKYKTKPPFGIVVLKPARIDIEKTLKHVSRLALKMVVTSSMDHPIGVAHALYQATELKKFYPNTLLDCGCLTHRVYKPNEFSTRIQTTGPYLKEIPGTGIGFNEVLENIKWTPVQK